MQNSLSYETALATLKVIDKYTVADFDTLGISEIDFDYTCGDHNWLRQDMSRCMRVLNCLLFGSLEIMGMPKITVPSEYVAAIVASFVSPRNRMTACVWLAQERQTGVGALELSARSQQGNQMDPTSADTLFALVVALSDTDASNEARLNFKRRIGMKIEEAGRLEQ